MKQVLTILFFSLPLLTFGQGLTVNELSKPGSGPRYIELVVVGDPCETVDIQGWIIDDNNGDFVNCPTPQALAGAGVSPGYLVFANDPLWAEVPTGTIIVLNGQGFPEDTDPCEDYKIEINVFGSSLILENEISPQPASGGSSCENRDCALNSGDPSYDLGPGGAPDQDELADPTGSNYYRGSGDACQIREPDGTFFMGFGWGTGSQGSCGAAHPGLNGGPDGIYLAPSDNYCLSDGTGGAYKSAGSWSEGCSDTRGEANDCANAAWIASMRTPLDDVVFDGSGTCVDPNNVLPDICIGEIVNIDITGCLSDNYNWSISSGSSVTINTSNDQSATIEGVANGTSIIQVEITEDNSGLASGCGDLSSTATVFYEITVGGASADISGGGTICPNQCTPVTVDITGGVQPYVINLTFQATGLPVPFPINIPGAGITTDIIFCLDETGFLPTFDIGTNTVTVPGILIGAGGTVTLNSITDATGCSGSVNPNPVNLTFIAGPSASSTSLTVCDDGSGTGVFDLTLLDADVLSGGSGTVSWYEDAAATIPIIPAVYIGGSTTVYAVVEDNGCTSDPVPVTLNLSANGDAGVVQMTCGNGAGGEPCLICDSDGIPGEDVILDFTFDEATTYIVELVYTINGFQQTNTFTLVGPTDQLFINIDGDASFAILSVTKDGDCKDTSPTEFVTTLYRVQPDIDPISNLSDCVEVILPTITGTNLSGNEMYYSGPFGAGSAYPAGSIIDFTTTLYVYDGMPGCEDEVQVEINIGGSALYDQPDDVNQCGNYTLPAISGTGVGANSAYFTEVDGGGTQFLPGDIITTDVTLYIYDPTAVCSNSQPSFSIMISPEPIFDTYEDIDTCGTYRLPDFMGSGFTNPGYFSGPNGEGPKFTGGDTIFLTDTLYLFDQGANCPQEDTFFVINIGPPTFFDTIQDVVSCGPFVLPMITGEEVGDSAAYYTEIDGAGTKYFPGDTILTTETLYLFERMNPCLENQPFFDVSIDVGPQIMMEDTIKNCGFLLLPEIQGTNLTGDQFYNTASVAQGDTLYPGDTIFTSQLIYAYDTNGSCIEQRPIEIIINEVPQSGEPLLGNLNICYTDGLFYNLFDALSGDYDLDGTWMEINTNLFDISDPTNIMIEGNYVGQHRFNYTVENDCGSSSTIATVWILPPVTAGRDTTINICEGGAMMFNLDSYLGQVRDYFESGGWFTTASSNSVDISNPESIDLSGLPVGLITFGYDVAGNQYCEADTAYINIMINPAPTAGSDNEVSVCQGNLIDLTNLVTEPGGNFTEVVTTGAITGTQFNTNLVGLGIYEVLYLTPDQVGCLPDTAVLTINIESELSAGDAAGADLCYTSALDLTQFINNGDPGGTFSSLSSAVTISNDSLIVPSDGGTFELQYLVGDGNTCPKDSTSITLIITPEPLFEIQPVSTEICFGDDLVFQLEYVFENSFSYSMSLLDGNDLLFQIDEQVDGTSQSGLISVSLDSRTIGLDRSITNNLTLVIDNISGNNCSSEAVLSLPVIIHPLYESMIEQSICGEETILVGNEVFDKDRLTGSVSLSSAFGCDSTITVNLTLGEPGTLVVDDVLCRGKTREINGITYDEDFFTDIQTLDIPAANGCDSIIDVQLDLRANTTRSYDEAICDMNYELILDGQTFNIDNPTGMFTLSIPNAQGCDSIVDVNLQFGDLGILDSIMGPDCIGENGMYTIVDVSKNSPSYTVSFDGNEETVSGFPVGMSLSPGSHTVEVSTEDDCSVSYQIVIPEATTLDYNINNTLLQDGSVQLGIDPSNGLTDINWSPSSGLSCGDCVSPIASQDNTYSVFFIDTNGCEQNLETRVETNTPKVITIPNIINPASSVAENRFFGIFTNDEYVITDVNLWLYDRWGNVVYNSPITPNSYGSGWNGTLNGNPVAEGVYVYLFEFKEADGTIKRVTGDLTIIY